MYDEKTSVGAHVAYQEDGFRAWIESWLFIFPTTHSYQQVSGGASILAKRPKQHMITSTVVAHNTSAVACGSRPTSHTMSRLVNLIGLGRHVLRHTKA